MRIIGGLVICFTLLLCFQLISAFDQIDITQAEQALNVKGFDAASAIGTSFSDSINPYTGALTVTQTDVALPGRNGLGVTLSRTYSSNIFLHNTQLLSGNPCTYKNNLVCDDCLPPSTIDWISTGVSSSDPVCKTGEDEEATSFIRAKMLGRGWDSTLGRIKTPTPKLFSISSQDFSIAPTYRWISRRGITKDSMILFNNEMDLIYPSMFREHNNLMEGLPETVFWNIGLAFGNFHFYETEFEGEWEVSFGEPYIDLVDYFSNIPYSLNMDYDLGGSYVNDLVYGSQENYGKYTLYTESISPVHFNYHTPQNADLPFGNVQGVDLDFCDIYEGGTVIEYPLECLAANMGGFGPEVTYNSRDGKNYIFENFVRFCREFDDSKCECRAFADNKCVEYTNPSEEARWAENPYPGTYLTQIRDNFGNYIDIEYESTDSTLIGKHSGNPFIHSITDTYNNDIIYSYKHKNGEFDLDSRIVTIQYPSPVNPSENLYVHYLYEDDCQTNLQQRPLLDYVYTSESSSRGTCDPISAFPETITKYEYHTESQELVKVTLGSGMTVEYEYIWEENMPSFDLTQEFRIEYDSRPTGYRRVVSKKIVENAGFCPETKNEWGGVIYENGTCVWTYDYKTLGNAEVVGAQFVDEVLSRPCVMGDESPEDTVNDYGTEVSNICLEVNVTDPFGTQSISKYLPATKTSSYRS